MCSFHSTVCEVVVTGVAPKVRQRGAVVFDVAFGPLLPLKAGFGLRGKVHPIKKSDTKSGDEEHESRRVMIQANENKEETASRTMETCMCLQQHFQRHPAV